MREEPITLHENREGRERAIGLLYEAEAKGVEATALVDEQLVASDFARRAVEGVTRLRPQIDRLITAHLRDWSFDRLAAVDRAVLRLATWELLEHSEAGIGVVLSEAVELAGEYSTGASKKFVNGVLGAIASEIRPS